MLSKNSHPTRISHVAAPLLLLSRTELALPLRPVAHGPARPSRARSYFTALAVVGLSSEVPVRDPPLPRFSNEFLERAREKIKGDAASDVSLSHLPTLVIT